MTDTGIIPVQTEDAAPNIDDTPPADPPSSDTPPADHVNASDANTDGVDPNASDANTDGANTDGADNDDSPSSAPESYADFTLPDGVTVDQTALDAAAPLLKEMGANQEQAQKLITWYAEQIKAGGQQQIEAFNQQKAEWRKQSESDKGFGGDKFDESVGTARVAIDKFGTPELKTLLEDSGLGNHPEVIRFMSNVGKLTKEDIPGGGDNPTNPQQDRVTLLYPKTESA